MAIRYGVQAADLFVGRMQLSKFLGNAKLSY